MTRVAVVALTGDAADRSAWLEAWALCGREPFAHPDYVKLFARGARTCCVVYRTEHFSVLLPLVIRPLEKNSESEALQSYDAISPYGYGGPFTSDRTCNTTEFWPSLVQWLAKQQLSSCFLRLDLNVSVPSTHLPGVTVRSDIENVVVNLARSELDQWMHYAHKVRKNVKKAHRAGLTVVVKEDFTDVEEFWELYISTMRRRQALSSYHFDLEFFNSIAEKLKGSYVAAEVRESTGRLVSAELVLQSDRHLYSYLGGTAADAFHHSPNDLLKHAVINYGRQVGRLSYVLGGGQGEDDGIVRYKRTFDPTGSRNFSRMEVIPDQARYDRLVAEHRTVLNDELETIDTIDNSFPQYRAGLTSVANIKKGGRM